MDGLGGLAGPLAILNMLSLNSVLVDRPVNNSLSLSSENTSCDLSVEDEDFLLCAGSSEGSWNSLLTNAAFIGLVVNLQLEAGDPGRSDNN